MSSVQTKALLLSNAWRTDAGAIVKGDPHTLADVATLAVSAVWGTDPEGARRFAAHLNAQLAAMDPKKPGALRVNAGGVR